MCLFRIFGEQGDALSLVLDVSTAVTCRSPQNL